MFLFVCLFFSPPHMESDLSSVKGLHFKGEHNLNILALSERLGRFYFVN